MQAYLANSKIPRNIVKLIHQETSTQYRIPQPVGPNDNIGLYSLSAIYPPLPNTLHGSKLVSPPYKIFLFLKISKKFSKNSRMFNFYCCLSLAHACQCASNDFKTEAELGSLAAHYIMNVHEKCLQFQLLNYIVIQSSGQPRKSLMWHRFIEPIKVTLNNTGCPKKPDTLKGAYYDF